MAKHVAIYVRVSTTIQDHKSQEPDLKRWADAQDEPVKFYRDKASGKTMDRPGWNQLEQAIRMGRVSKVVVWRLDRLGRSVSGLSALFDNLRERKVTLISLRDDIDLLTSSGRLMANVLASVAAYEREVTGERIRAGQAATKASGKKWGGSQPGVRKVVKPEKARAIIAMRERGENISAIARTVGVSRPTVYSVLGTVK